MKKLFYLPLEPYIERYTYLMSSVDGWTETWFKKFGVNFQRVDGETLGNSIGTGVVLDAYGRSYYAMTQLCKLIKLIKNGDVKNDDVIYVEDFWHPGIESLFYIRHLTGINFKIGTFLHAQSVDDSDFTYSMREWMRHIEVGYGKGFDYIFVTSPILKKLCIEGGIGTEDKIHVVGLPYNSSRLLEQLKDMGYEKPKKEDYVIFSSRFDDEKDPMFFLDVVENCPDIKFVLVTPRKTITSNKQVMERLNKILNNDNSNLTTVNTREKINYYTALAKAKVQFNCAIQDWTSWTLLEAVTFKCIPLYPIHKDFPDELNYDERYLYKRKDLEDCCSKLRVLMSSEFDPSVNHVVERHDKSWEKYLTIMELI